jgi:hypothetical protein
MKVLLIACGFILFNFCLVFGVAPLEMPSSFVIERPFIKYFTNVKFKTSHETIATGKSTTLLNGKKGFILWDGNKTLLASAALHLLLPEKDPLFVFRDEEEHVVAYLHIRNLSIFKLFKPVKTVLYGSDGHTLLKSTYILFGNSFKVYDPNSTQKIPLLNAHKCWKGNFEVSIHQNIDVDAKALLTMLLIQANKEVLHNPERYLHWNMALHMDDLERFSLSSYIKDVVCKEIQMEDTGIRESDASQWEALQALTKNCFTDLKEKEKISIAESLAAHFENEYGEVDPADTLAAFSYLSLAEKAVLRVLIDAKMSYYLPQEGCCVSN